MAAEISWIPSRLEHMAITLKLMHLTRLNSSSIPWKSSPFVYVSANLESDAVWLLIPVSEGLKRPRHYKSSNYECHFKMSAEPVVEAKAIYSDSDSDSGSIEQPSSPSRSPQRTPPRKLRWTRPPITTVTSDPLSRYVLFDGSQAVSWSFKAKFQLLMSTF